MAAATSIVPFQPPTGLSVSQALAHAVDHIGKVVKKHENLRRDKEALEQQIKSNETAWSESKKQHYGTAVEIGVTGVGGAVMGLINAKWGNGKDHATCFGVPIDVTVMAAGHVAGLVAGQVLDDEVGRLFARGLHAAGNSSLGVVTYRLAYQKARELWGGAPAAAGAQANGVKGGTVYAAPAQAPHK